MTSWTLPRTRRGRRGGDGAGDRAVLWVGGAQEERYGLHPASRQQGKPDATRADLRHDDGAPGAPGLAGGDAVTHVAMESTGVYWKAVYYVLEEAVTCLLVNPAHMAQVPGRKTDVQDCVWIAQL